MDVLLKTDEDIKNMFSGNAPKSHDALLAYNLFWLLMDWDVYSCKGLDFAAKDEGGTAWEAQEAISRFLIKKYVKDYSKPVDRKKWVRTPQTVNCFYNPQNNNITILGAFANFYLTKDTLQRAYARINDTHPMMYLRVNCTLQQFDEFLDFYDIKDGDNMYLAPEDRVAIW